MDTMHSLLKRQLKRHFGDSFSVPEEWRGFVQSVNEAYREFDADRGMLERSLELSSQELLQANSEMRAIFQAIPDLLFRLDYEGTILEYAAGDTSDFSRNPRELLGKRIQDVPSREVAEQFNAVLERVRETRSTAVIEYCLPFDERNHYYEARLIPLIQDQIIAIVRNITDRKLAEAVAQAEKEKYRLLVRQVPGVVFKGYADYGLDCFDNKIETLTGYTQGEFNSRAIKWNDVVLEEYIDPVRKQLKKALKNDGFYVSEFRIRKKSGELIWVQARNQVVKNVQDRIDYISGVFFDITEQKLAADAIARERILSDQIINSLPGIFYMFDDQGDFVRWNKRYEEVTGYSSEELLGMYVLDFFPEAHKHHIALRVQSVFAEGEAFAEAPLLTKGGEQIPYFFTGRLALLDGKQHLLGVGVDITERRMAEKALSLQESYLRAIIENQPGLVWLKDTGSRFLVVNNALARSCGKEQPEDVLGKTDLDIWPEELAEKYRADDKDVMTRRVPIAVEERIFDQGAVKWFHTFKTPVFATNGEVLGTCGFAIDVTERKWAEEEQRRLEERLQRAEKMEAMGTLAGGVAHDLNNVLGIVVGYSELILYDLSASGSTKSKAVEIMKGGQKAAAIVQDLLTLARRGVSNREVLNLNNIILECQNSPEFTLVCSYHPNIRVKTDMEAHPLNISGSAVHLGKSLMNLMSNAAEAMPEGGLITIQTGNQYLDRPVSGYDVVREGDYVVLSVSDTGEGIAASDLKRIFEPFYTKKVMGRSGTGLGLAVVWGTVKDHEGYINVESDEGKGTTFTLYFPVTREEITQELVSISAAEYMGNGESILIVDDVKEQRELVSAMLKKLNYTVVSASSGEEAVEYLKQNTVDLVVLDMIMNSGMDGLDTYAKILEIHPHQRAIIVSGFSETERVSKAQALGAGAYVKKPYVLEKLGLAVRKELDRTA